MTALHVRLEKLLCGVRSRELESVHIVVDVDSLVVQIEACFARTYRIGGTALLLGSQCSRLVGNRLIAVSRRPIGPLMALSVAVYMQIAEPLDLRSFPYEARCSRVVVREQIFVHEVPVLVAARLSAQVYLVLLTALILVMAELSVCV